MKPSAILAFTVAAAASAPAVAADAVADATFACDGGKSIAAAFYPDRVDLRLSDGRSLSLPQAISASGARYANADETMVFWNSGNTAFVTEGADGAETYSGCILVADADPGWQTFASAEKGFSLRYPPGYTVDESYVYEGLGPGQGIAGVSFTIPAALADGTNLSADTRLSVETLPEAESCTADRFLPAGAAAPTDETEDGTDYSVASFSDAGAGNLYDQTVYALVGTAPCLAVRYFIHSTNIANYDPGTVTAFDEAALVAEFDAIRRTLVIGR